ncbi:DeoR/GlpR family DNA-binding transcription regulator [Petrotoga olearia]|uniref:HTH deoR-type domain-containing protein n=2 Tax=Petrotoga olearia TaxID=156203 RepID=A0A2K1P3G6_9BACT|nr:DeoR/GlpR family DNA-binding transcription regulator [Petrotoga olearia]PNR97301.1 hypothetical protein X929_03405 [Petrotoga olearia DSM 13574]RMA76692.1 DeoR family transcriptional regulator [Petrotoga olearia]
MKTNSTKLIPEERRRRILQLLEKEGSITVFDLSQILKVSFSTVRNDLNYLEREGLIKRTHGGAIAKERFNPLFQKEIAGHAKEKLEIAKYAVQFVENDDTIFIDAGSTTLAFTEELINSNKKCHIVTNSLYIINALSNSIEINLHVLGGEFIPSNMNFIDLEQNFEKYKFKKAFMGVNGFNEEGFYVHELSEANFKKKIIKSAKVAYVLADHSKYNKICANLVEKWKQNYILVTDDRKIEI